ncbi:MAG: hypothetical protein J6D54_03540 [Olsenella sp.]|nr:hypothetical protein [Olsenella sp.]
MARIALSEGFRNLEEGEDVILTITSSTYDTKTATAKIRFEDGDGRSGVETFRFGKAKRKGAAQMGALNAYSTIAKTALRNWEVEDIDPDELVGRHVLCDVVATEADNGNKYTHPRNFRDAELDEVYDPDGTFEDEEEEVDDDLEDDEEDLFS